MKSHSLAPSDFAGAMAGRLNALVAIDDAIALICAGAPLAIAGRKEALDQLPAGNWIGGTTPYFLTADGGEMVDATRVFVTDFSGLGPVTSHHYSADALQDITEEALNRVLLWPSCRFSRRRISVSPRKQVPIRWPS
jgi:hypothetical protein